LVPWTHRDPLTQKPHSNGCLFCRTCIAKAWAINLFPKYKAKMEYLVAIRTDPNVRQVHVAAVELVI